MCTSDRPGRCRIKLGHSQLITYPFRRVSLPGYSSYIAPRSNPGGGRPGPRQPCTGPAWIAWCASANAQTQRVPPPANQEGPRTPRIGFLLVPTLAPFTPGRPASSVICQVRRRKAVVGAPPFWNGDVRLHPFFSGARVPFAPAAGVCVALPWSGLLRLFLLSSAWRCPPSVPCLSPRLRVSCSPISSVTLSPRTC